MSPDPFDTIAGRYVLEEPIAHGGMATVWKARDEVLARFVALKILDPELAKDPSFLDRFRTEALAAARLAHPNIVQTYDTGEDETGNHFIVMEYCAGGTLEDLAKRLALRAVGGEAGRKAVGVSARHAPSPGRRQRSRPSHAC